jgi:hypothetical protein
MKNANGKVIKKITIDYGSDSYKEGIYDGRKQTLEEVLKDLDDDMKTGLNDNRFLINKYKQKIKAME